MNYVRFASAWHSFRDEPALNYSQSMSLCSVINPRLKILRSCITAKMMNEETSLMK